MIDHLLNWSKKNYSHLPWRTKRSLYHTLVSEIMLQQTTVSTVMNKFDSFITKYPNLETLAKANETEILIAWKGLGYYRRAKNLLAAAKMIRDQFSAKIPTEYDELVKIKGIGDYTACALLAIGMNERYLAIDSNIQRVVSRFYGYHEASNLLLNKKIQNDYKKRVIFSDDRNPRKLNEALMDLGRTYCQLRKVSCEICPLNINCIAFRKKKQLIYPAKSEKKVKAVDVDLLRVIARKNNSLYFYKKSNEQWLSGQWELPTFTLSKIKDDKLYNQYQKVPLDLSFDSKIFYKTTITKYKFKNYFHIAQKNSEVLKFFEKNKVQYQLFNINELLNLNISTSSFKALRNLGIIKN